MSHRPERKEKDCLNCGAIVAGRYCQVCGQENFVPKETFLGMVQHFFEDITHFDGKFFTTLRILIAKPGFLPAEYMRGRRASYLNPVRMYVFTSALFFLVFFAMTDKGPNFAVGTNEPYTLAQRDSIMLRLEKKFQRDSSDVGLRKQMALTRDTLIELRPADLIRYNKDFNVISMFGEKYYSIREYDSAQAARPKKERDGFFKKLWNRKAAGINQKYRYRGVESMKDFSQTFLHKLPYILFVSLPFFALILKLMYYRRKNFYYGDHAIFSIHHYVFSFMLILLMLILGKVEDYIHWKIWDILQFICFLIGPIYLFIAMRRFYKQGFFKTLMKFIVLNISALLVLLLLFAVFGLYAVFQL